jgi:D-tyrosyl-tRNA(Tyr) deacylase
VPLLLVTEYILYSQTHDAYINNDSGTVFGGKTISMSDYVSYLNQFNYSGGAVPDLILHQAVSKSTLFTMHVDGKTMPKEIYAGYPNDLCVSILTKEGLL